MKGLREKSLSMKNLIHYLQTIDIKDTKTYLTRPVIEKMCLCFILLCAISVFFNQITTVQTLNLDEGVISYKGSVLAGKPSGQGTVTFENGDTYEGEFKNGIFNGEGLFTAASGWTYEGEFKNGIADGKGTLTTENNVIYKGTFKQGIFQHAN